MKMKLRRSTHCDSRILNLLVLKRIILLIAVCLGGAIVYAHFHWHRLPPGTTIDHIVVEKSARRLSVWRNGEKLKTYRVALGLCPVGRKEQEGDMKTPEGIYAIDYRNPHSDYHLALHISYPSPEDEARAAARGVPAGYDIMIHGLPNGHGWIDTFGHWKDWTAGCIALTDDEIEELWRVTPDGTPVEIRP